MMDFDQSGGVTLVGFRPFQTDISPYAPPPSCHAPPQFMEIGVSCHGVTPTTGTSAASLPIAASSMNAAAIGASMSPTSALSGTMCSDGGAASTVSTFTDHRPPPAYGYAVPEPPTSHYEPPHPFYGAGAAGQPAAQSCMHAAQPGGPYTPTSPAMSIATTSDLEDFEGIFPDTGPMPMIDLPAEPPNKMKRRDAGGSFYPGMPLRNTHSKQLMVAHGHGLTGQQHSKSSRGRSSSKHSMRPILRTKSPLFPQESTPLTSLSRQPSISSMSSSTAPPSVRSDPGVYRHVIHSGNPSPAYSLQDSPKFNFAASESSASNSPPAQPDSASRSCLELEMPAKYSRKISEIDKKILELQAKRSKLLEKVHSEKGTGPVPYVGRGDFDNLWMNVSDKSSDIGKVLLYIFPLGIREFDEPIYEEANAILRQVGGMYFDLQKALSNLRDMCCKGSIIVPEISTCFAYIHSLLHTSQRLKLTELTKGIYTIQLDLETTGTPDEPPIPTEFYVTLNAANDVLTAAQRITQTNATMQMNLQQVRQRASEKIANFDTICSRLDIAVGERKNQIKSVLEGYRVAIASAERVWLQYYHVATDTITTITECIHPSSSS